MATKKGNTAMVPWDKKFAEFAAKSTEQVSNLGGGGGVGIKFGRGRISVGGADVPGNKLEVIILDAVGHNRWWEGAYDPSNGQAPDCYAFSLLPSEPKAPMEEASKVQSDTCKDCERNVMGSSITGRGKACANGLRLGAILAKDIEDGEDAKNSEMATAFVSYTNRKHYKAYVDMIAAEYKRPIWGVITELSSYDDPKTQIRVEFKFVDLLEDVEIIEALAKRVEVTAKQLMVPYNAAVEKAALSKGTINKKFAAKKAPKR